MVDCQIMVCVVVCVAVFILFSDRHLERHQNRLRIFHPDRTGTSIGPAPRIVLTAAQSDRHLDRIFIILLYSLYIICKSVKAIEERKLLGKQSSPYFAPCLDRHLDRTAGTSYCSEHTSDRRHLILF